MTTVVLEGKTTGEAKQVRQALFGMVDPTKGRVKEEIWDDEGYPLWVTILDGPEERGAELLNRVIELTKPAWENEPDRRDRRDTLLAMQRQR